MEALTEQVSLKGKMETISITEFRLQPGEVLVQVKMGKTYVITRGGREVAVLSPMPGVELTTVIKPDGSREFKLPS